MKWINTKFLLLVLPVLLVGTSAMYAQTALDAWGAIGNRLEATGWTLDNDGDTPAGDAYLSGDGTSSNWTGIRAGFPAAMSPTVDQAVVVSGQMEIIGADVDEWNPFRWGIYRHDDFGTLNFQNTDSAAWGTVDGGVFTLSPEANAHGYLAVNQTGTQQPVGGNGGSGSAHAVNGGSWISTFSGGTVPLGSPDDHAPRFAIMPPGMYDFAMSVQLLDDGTSELRWYLVSADGVTYWHGGVHNDTTAQKTDLNGFAFSFRPEVEGVTGINLFGVEVSMGDAIELPEKPFSAFYVDAWGALGNRLEATGWTLDNDSTTLVGDAYLSGEGTSSNWTAIRGGFGGTQSATLDEALIVTGEFEIIGAEVDEWNPFRWGLYRHDEMGSLNFQYTDSAAWGEIENAGTDSAAFVLSSEAGAHGYLAVNQTGTQQPVGGNGGSGSAHAVNGGSWISTFSGGTVPLGSPFSHAPRFAVMPVGSYEFAMSVQPQVDGTTELRWYIVSSDGVSYWHGGVHTDTSAAKTDFDGFAFSFRPEVEGVTGINLYEVQIDRGAAIELPERPFSPFYVDAWGALGNRLEATGWTLDNDSTTLVGDAYLSGEGTSSNWTAIRGGFGESQFATEDEALIVTGEFEIIGADVDEWNPFRWGLYAHDEMGSLNFQYTDSAAWGEIENAGTDSAAFVLSSEAGAHGYLAVNQTGTQQPVGGNGGSGSAHAVNGGSWISTFSGGTVPLGSPFAHAPRFAIMPVGVYEFAMSVQPLSDGTTELRWYIVSEDEESYWHGGVHNDTTAQKTEFTGFAFSFRPEVEGVTGINLYEVQIDRGAPIVIPPAPFSPFYVDAWGFLGPNFGAADGDSAWSLTPGELVGDVTISGEAATGPAVVAGSFGLSVTPAEEAVTVTADITLEGGGFEDDNSFGFGLYSADLGSQDSTETVGYVWTGDETANGYFVVPGNGTATAPTWADGQVGTFGGIAGGVWWDTEGEGAYSLSDVVATGTPTAGTYELVMKSGPTEDGMGVRVMLTKDDGSYTYEAVVIDGSASKASATTAFNSVIFGIENSTTTSLRIEALEVTMEEFSPVAIEDERDGSIPEVYALEQNYPNPFNPTTNIKFSLPEAADVSLAVYNMLGQRVMTLVSGSMQPGFHQVDFDAGSLASGMYMYRIEAGDFVSTRKMMLLK